MDTKQLYVIKLVKFLLIHSSGLIPTDGALEFAMVRTPEVVPSLEKGAFIIQCLYC